jgi:pimeloyl-ACP methyl ester carboxylesterase
MRALTVFAAIASSTRDASAAVRDLHALLARAGIVPPYVLVAHSLAGPALPDGLNALLARQWQRPDSWRSLTSADEAADTTSCSEQVVREQRNYGNMPLIVLSEKKFIDEFGPLPPTQRRALLEASTRWHDRIAALSSRGENVLVRGSGHDIPIDRPSSVISAIDKVIGQARALH